MDNNDNTLTGMPDQTELGMINKLSRRHLAAEEVFVFSVVLCDNEIDRDFERFTVEALNKLAVLYVGKTGIYDHSGKGKDQLARIFKCEVEAVPGKTTKAGETYHRLKARAYMPRTAANADLIMEIDAGIKKEVSVGCAAAERICSVCGANVTSGECNHIKGRRYTKNGKSTLCHAVLTEPTDAYEWSFVAVPAQPEAGVIKAFSGCKRKAEKMDIEKSLAEGAELTLTAEQSTQLYNELCSLRKLAKSGEEYLNDMRAETVRLCLSAQPELTTGQAESIVNKMDGAELKAFKEACARSVSRLDPVAPQLGNIRTKKEAGKDNRYII